MKDVTSGGHYLLGEMGGDLVWEVKAEVGEGVCIEVGQGWGESAKDEYMWGQHSEPG